MKRLGLLIAPLLLTACSATPEVQPIAAADLETQVAARVEDEFTVPVDVTCPSSLNSEVGATTQCVLTPEGSTSAVVATLTVTDVTDDGQVEFSVSLDVPESVESEPATEAPATQSSDGS